MTKSKYVFKNISFVNLFLIAVLAFIITYSVLPQLNMQIKFVIPLQKKINEQQETREIESPTYYSADYHIISEENLFHPERRIPPEKKDEAPPLPKPDLVLYGTVITDSISVAYVEDLKSPRNTPGRGKRQISLKKGDVLSGFKLSEIHHDRIIMVKGEEKMTVFVIDPQRQKTRESVVAAQPPTSATSQPVRPTRTPPRKSVATKKELPPSLGGKPEPLPKIRAPITPADEKIQDFFKRQRQ